MKKILFLFVLALSLFSIHGKVDYVEPIVSQETVFVISTNFP
jgi:hypothetical protein